MRVYNFAAGPATLPEPILRQAQQELLNYNNTGVSPLEINHRSQEFEQIIAEAEADLRELMAIPDNYHVLFLSGGARTQFAMVPMNLLTHNKSADYIDSGYWSQFAAREASIYGEINIPVSSKTLDYKSIPSESSWQLNPDAAYVHYTTNETITGVEFPFIPNSGNVPLISDMSSNILSAPLDVSKFGIIYACAQKNIAPAGITIVIIREDLVGEPMPFTPSMLQYKKQVEFNSTFNTPPIFNWYMAGLMFKWLKAEGGLEVIAERNQAKAKKLYDYIDSTDFYINDIDPTYRSKMNVPFTLSKPELTDTFIIDAQSQGLHSLKGHPMAGGGMRASIYNAMPMAGVDALIAFMQKFKG